VILSGNSRDRLHGFRWILVMMTFPDFWVMSSRHCVASTLRSATRSSLSSNHLNNRRLRTTATMLLNDLSTLSEPIVLVWTIPPNQIRNYSQYPRVPAKQSSAYCAHHHHQQNQKPLSLSRLRARGQLTELHISDLRFTTDETTEFLRSCDGSSIEDDIIAALEARTEGWIAGLQLAALSFRKVGDQSEFLKTFSVDTVMFWIIWLTKVISQQPTHNSVLSRANVDPEQIDWPVV